MLEIKGRERFQVTKTIPKRENTGAKLGQVVINSTKLKQQTEKKRIEKKSRRTKTKTLRIMLKDIIAPHFLQSCSQYGIVRLHSSTCRLVLEH